MEIQITQNNLSLIRDYKYVVVDFFATWCGPCKTQSKIITELSQEFAERSDVAIAKLDVDQNQFLAKDYQVTSIPTIIYFKDGELVKKVVGINSADAIRKFLHDS